MLIATGAAHLGRVSRVYLLDRDTTGLRLIANEAIQLGKCPTVQASFVLDVLIVLASAHFRGLPNVGEIFKDNRTACGGMLDKAFREDVITVSVESHLLLRQLFQVPLSGLRSFRLELTPQTETAAINFLPVFASQELTVGSHGWPIESQVYSDHGLVPCELWFRDTDHDVQVKPSLFEDEIGGTRAIALVLSIVSWNGKGESHASLRSRQAYRVGLPVQSGGVNIVANRTEQTLRTLNRLKYGNGLTLFQSFLNPFRVGFFVFALPCQSTFDRLRGFGTGLDKQVRDELGTQRFRLIVGLMMQSNAVLLLVFPSVVAHRIESYSELLKRLMKGLGLFRRWVQLYSYRSVHTESVPYMLRYCQS